LGGLNGREFHAALPTGVGMAKAKVPPKPASAGGCTEIGGITLCPHLVHLTRKQMAKVHKMHADNIETIRKHERKTAKADAKKKKAKKKKAKA
jgi:hypothetical protein